MTTKPSKELTLTDQLSRLSLLQACRLLGENGNRLIQAGAKYEIDIDEQVSWTGKVFRLWLPDTGTNGNGAAVTIRRADEGRRQLRWSCSACEAACEHACSFSLILEEKTVLAAPPPDRAPVVPGKEELVHWLDERASGRARRNEVRRSSGMLWTDYTVISAISGKTYRVALRGRNAGSHTRAGLRPTPASAHHPCAGQV
jgi:hypothetical protein